MPVTVGGGVRTVEDVRALLLAGADKVSINTAAVARPRASSREASEKFGAQAIVVAIDAKRVSRAGDDRPLGDLHPWRPHADRHRRGRLRRARSPASAPARSCSPRWTATAPATASTSR